MTVCVHVGSHKDPDFKITKKAVEILSSFCRTIFLDNQSAFEALQPNSLLVLEKLERALEKSKLLLVLGGDGSMLRCAPAAAKAQVPILGINLGRLGYLTSLEPEEIDQLQRLAKADYRIEKRALLDINVVRNGHPIYHATGLNDAVITKGILSKIIDLSAWCNGVFLGDFRADGLIAFTPTGSTAYSLSAGGPFVDPSVQMIGLTPICPFSLGSRAVILPQDSVLEIVNESEEEREAYVTVDGAEAFKLLPQDKVCVRLSTCTLEIVKMSEYHFIGLLNKKMHGREKGEEV